jgi:phospholipase/carboxylesterase
MSSHGQIAGRRSGGTCSEGGLAIARSVPRVLPAGNVQMHNPSGWIAFGREALLQQESKKMARRVRLFARPRKVSTTVPAGLQLLGAAEERDSYLYVPAGHNAAEPRPLMLLLHGSGGHAHHGVDVLQQLADEFGLIVAAPVSADYAWELVASRHGPDVAVVDRALEHVFQKCAVDPTRIAIAGFSDGGSHALALGLANGDFFSHVIAFSPGFVLIGEELGQPRVFIAHGTRDEIQPIFACSRRVVPQLEGMGLDPEYVEFEAGHRIPEDIARQAVEWFTGAAESAHEPLSSLASETRSSPEG